MFTSICSKYRQLEEFERVCVWILVPTLIFLLALLAFAPAAFSTAWVGLFVGIAISCAFAIWNDLTVPHFD